MCQGAGGGQPVIRCRCLAAGLGRNGRTWTPGRLLSGRFVSRRNRYPAFNLV